MTTQTVITSNNKETAILAGDLAKNIINNPKDKAIFIALYGDLGAGKTAFSKGFIKFLGFKGKIVSPTFNIAKKYSIKSDNFDSVWHFDCYRLNNPKELEILRYKDITNNPKNIILMEWPEKSGKLPKEAIKIKFSYGKSENERKIRIQ